VKSSLLFFLSVGLCGKQNKLNDVGGVFMPLLLFLLGILEVSKDDWLL
jgi:branched-subunit amino acid permease